MISANTMVDMIKELTAENARLRAELQEREKELDKAKEAVGVYYTAWQKELKHESVVST